MRAATARLPTGTVTLLFSDIEASTRLLETLGEAYVTLLDDHHRLLRSAWAAHRGVEVSTDGDAFFVAFADAQDAVEAARAAQCALRSHAWPAGARVKVRMGVHTGQPGVAAGEDDYWGIDVHFAARVAAAAHGGQVLVSAATARCVSAPVEDLGEWRLKGFDAPGRLFHLMIDGEGADAFPSPRAMDVLRTNLPRPATEILGREAELAAVSRMLRGSATQLVTIVGLGGSGKTRLALELGHTLLEHFTGGVFWVDLSGVTEPAAIPRAVADAIAAPDRPDTPPAVTVGEHLRSRRVLLVIDNCEHLIAGAGVIASWLQSASELRVLATSQVPLRLRAERCVPLESLGLPRDPARDLEELAASPSVRLFVERAKAADPRFELSAGNAGAVAEVCRRLDGMPMAIELAAARSRLLTADQLARRLRTDYSVLATAARDVPDRQASLQSALDWTLGLLEPEQRAVFARWGVFAGRPGLEPAEAICGDGLDGLAAIEALVDMSLLRRDADARLRMPQSVHAYARQLLQSSEEPDVLHRRHAAVMADVADAQYVGFWLDTGATLTGAVADRDDLYAALRWARDRDPDLHARLAGSMSLPLLVTSGLLGVEPDVDEALARCGQATQARIRLLVARAVIAYARGDRDRERTTFEDAVRLAAALGDAREHALALTAYAKAVTTSDQPGVDPHELLDAAGAAAAALRDDGLAKLIDGLRAEAFFYEGRLEEAERLHAVMLGDADARHFAAFQSAMPSDIALARKDYRDALDMLVTTLREARASGLEPDMAWNVQRIGCCLIALGRPEPGLALVAGGEAHSERLDMPGRPRALVELVDEQVAAAARTLSQTEAQRALSHGRDMGWDQVLGLALRAGTIARTGPGLAAA